MPRFSTRTLLILIGTHLLLFVVGIRVAWRIQPVFETREHYVQAEDFQQSIGTTNDASKISDSLLNGRTVMTDANGDKVIIVNKGFLLRFKANSNFGQIEEIKAE